MASIDSVGKKQLVDLLSKNWMTHDAMWFFHCLAENGIEKANRINRQAVYSMGQVEIKRLMKLINLAEISTFEDLQRIFFEGFEIIRPAFMEFTYRFPEKNLLRWEAPGCFAFDGISRLGVIDEYECGVIERLYGWLDGAGVQFTVKPDTSACLLRREGRCVREIRTYLP